MPRVDTKHYYIKSFETFNCMAVLKEICWALLQASNLTFSLQGQKCPGVSTQNVPIVGHFEFIGAKFDKHK